MDACRHAHAMRAGGPVWAGLRPRRGGIAHPVHGRKELRETWRIPCVARATPHSHGPAHEPSPVSPRRFSRYSGMRIIGGRSWSASSMDLERQPAAPGARQLHRGAQLREQPRPASLLEPLHHRLEDHERHPRQALELLVAVDAALEVDLPQALDARLARRRR